MHNANKSPNVLSLYKVYMENLNWKTKFVYGAVSSSQLLEVSGQTSLFLLMITFLLGTFLFQCKYQQAIFNILRPRQNGRHFAEDTLKCIFVNENARILIEISLTFVPKGPINIIPTLVQILAWPQLGDKPLSQPMMASLLTHICVTWPQWVNRFHFSSTDWPLECLNEM